MADAKPNQKNEKRKHHSAKAGILQDTFWGLETQRINSSSRTLQHLHSFLPTLSGMEQNKLLKQ